jgi:hypothetical protein
MKLLNDVKCELSFGKKLKVYLIFFFKYLNLLDRHNLEKQKFTEIEAILNRFACFLIITLFLFVFF